MTYIQPDILGILPEPVIRIHLASNSPFGSSAEYQLVVKLTVTGANATMAIGKLVVLNPGLYRFTGNLPELRYNIPLQSNEQEVQLGFAIENKSATDPLPDLFLGLYTWEQQTGEGISDFDHIQCQVAIEAPKPITFKTF